jgi:hypothetical protein
MACVACSNSVSLGTAPRDATAEAFDQGNAPDDLTTPDVFSREAPDLDADAPATNDAPPEIADVREEEPPPRGTRYVARMSGAEMVPWVDTDQTAEADLYLDRDAGTVDVRARHTLTEDVAIELVQAWAGENGPTLRALPRGRSQGRLPLSPAEADALEGGRLTLVLRAGMISLRGQITRPGERVLVGSVETGGYFSFVNSYSPPSGARQGNAQALYDPTTLRLRYHFARLPSCASTMRTIDPTHLAYDGQVSNLLGTGCTVDGELSVTRNFNAALARYRVDLRNGPQNVSPVPTALLVPPGTRVLYSMVYFDGPFSPFRGGASVMIVRPWRSREMSVRVVINADYPDQRYAIVRAFAGETIDTWLTLPTSGDTQFTVTEPPGFDDDLRDGRWVMTGQAAPRADAAVTNVARPLLPPGQWLAVATLDGTGVTPPVDTVGRAAYRFLFDANERTVRVRGRIENLDARAAILRLPTRSIEWPAQTPEREEVFAFSPDEPASGMRMILTTAARPEGEIGGALR